MNDKSNLVFIEHILENINDIESFSQGLTKEKLKKNKSAFAECGIKPRVVGLLEENEEEAFFSKTLATIRRDAPITFVTPEHSWQTEVDEKKLVNLFDELEFATLKRRALALIGVKEENQPANREPAVNKVLFTKARIALWLLNSNKTDATLEDIRAHTKDGVLETALKKLEKLK